MWFTVDGCSLPRWLGRVGWPLDLFVQTRSLLLPTLTHRCKSVSLRSRSPVFLPLAFVLHIFNSFRFLLLPSQAIDTTASLLLFPHILSSAQSQADLPLYFFISLSITSFLPTLTHRHTVTFPFFRPLLLLAPFILPVRTHRCRRSWTQRRRSLWHAPCGPCMRRW